MTKITKLAIKLDEDVIARAKRYAKNRKTSPPAVPIAIRRQKLHPRPGARPKAYVTNWFFK